jgi:hypothetical protein
VSDEETEQLCPLCGRPLVSGPSVNRHHLTPRKFKGRVAVDIHAVCHDKIHAVLSEREIARDYDSIDKLKEHPQIAEFIKWVAKKSPEFVDGHESKNRGRR